jgi:hypothetical protein
MIELTQITQSEEQPTAVVHLTVPWGEIKEVMEPAIREVLSALADQAL